MPVGALNFIAQAAKFLSKSFALCDALSSLPWGPRQATISWNPGSWFSNGSSSQGSTGPKMANELRDKGIAIANEAVAADNGE